MFDEVLERDMKVIKHNFLRNSWSQYRADNDGGLELNRKIGDVFVNIGPMSYVANMKLSNTRNCYVLIGKYSSIMDDVILMTNDPERINGLNECLEIILKERNDLSEDVFCDELFEQQIIIGNDVLIEPKVIIYAGVQIGNGAIVKAGAIVKKNVPPYAIVEGNNGEVVGYRFNPVIIQLMNRIKWWNWKYDEIVKNVKWIMKPNLITKNLPNKYARVEAESLDLLKSLRKGDGYLFGMVAHNGVLPKKGKKIYEHIIEFFLRKAKKTDVLLIALPPYYKELEWPLTKIIISIGDERVKIVCLPGEFNYTFLKACDYFFIGWQFVDSMYIDYATETDTQVIRAVEIDPFVIYSKETKAKCVLSSNNKVVDIEEKKQIIKDYIEKGKKDVYNYMSAYDYENAMQKIRQLGVFIYNYNQEYTDDDLEVCIRELSVRLAGEKTWTRANKTVLFYDGFGLDTRGLAANYLDALSYAEYKIVYLVPSRVKGKIPTLERILSKASNFEIVYFNDESMLLTYYSICDCIDRYRPTSGFFYTTPQDVSAIVAFMQYEKRMIRYKLNLTDHAFWLGRDVMDWCVESRDYGASISVLHRKIPESKLLKVDIYPYFEDSQIFRGFPFKKTESDFVIFSGGTLYKTIDASMNFYIIIDFVLSNYPNVKFWYAGAGDDTYLKILMGKYPGRVFFTEERKDIFAILQNVDMFLNTYPFAGGLMTQYSAAAGRIPITLKHFEDNSGFLPHPHDIKFEFESVDDILNEIGKLIEDSSYRAKREKGINLTASNKIEFRNRIKEILLNPTPSHFYIHAIDTKVFRDSYLERS